MNNPEEIFTQTFHNITNRFSIVNSLRHVAEIGLSGAIPGIYQEWLDFSHKLVSDPEYDHLFIDKEKAIRDGGGVEGMGRMMAENQLRTFQTAVEAASLVFAHSILDSAAMDYLRVTTLQGQKDLAEYVNQKQVPISEVQEKHMTACLKKRSQRTSKHSIGNLF